MRRGKCICNHKVKDERRVNSPKKTGKKKKVIDLFEKRKKKERVTANAYVNIPSILDHHRAEWPLIIHLF